MGRDIPRDVRVPQRPKKGGRIPLILNHNTLGGEPVQQPRRGEDARVADVVGRGFVTLLRDVPGTVRINISAISRFRVVGALMPGTALPEPWVASHKACHDGAPMRDGLPHLVHPWPEHLSPPVRGRISVCPGGDRNRLHGRSLRHRPRKGARIASPAPTAVLGSPGTMCFRTRPRTAIGVLPETSILLYRNAS